MSGSLADSYSTGDTPLDWRLVKFTLLFSIFLPATVLVGVAPTTTLVIGLLSIGAAVGITADSIRDAVVEAGFVAGACGLTIVLTPIIAPLFGLSVTPSSTDLLLLFPFLIVSATIVSLALWYLDWYLTLRHGSMANGIHLWVSGEDDPRLPGVGAFQSFSRAFAIGGSLVLIALVITAVVAPTAFLTLVPQSLSEPVEPMEPANPDPSAQVELYAGVSVEQIEYGSGLGVEVFVFNFGTAESVDIMNERTGETVTLTPDEATGRVSGEPGDTIRLIAAAGSTQTELREVTLRK
jgi:hypothetical protein